jgi:cytochrome b
MNAEMRSIEVWDLPTRIFHWSLAVLVAIELLSGGYGGLLFRIHMAGGYLILLLIAFRLAWGLVGGEHARFGDFVTPWRTVRRHLTDVLRLRHERAIGHNPLGGLAILAILAVLLATVLTGLVSGGRHGAAGPLLGLVAGLTGTIGLRGIHAFLVNLVYLLIGVHLLGVAVMSVLGHENLVVAMVSGRKRVPRGEPARDAWRAHPALAGGIALLLVVVGIGLFAATPFTKLSSGAPAPASASHGAPVRDRTASAATDNG